MGFPCPVYMVTSLSFIHKFLQPKKKKKSSWTTTTNVSFFMDISWIEIENIILDCLTFCHTPEWFEIEIENI